MSTREAQRLETRRRIYEAALTIFRRDGVIESRTDDIANLAGVSRGAFYFHFPTKEQVLVERMRETESVITGEIDKLPEDAPLEKVLNTVNRTLAAIWEPEPKLLPEIVAVGLRVAALTMHDQQATPLRYMLSNRFKDAAARGELDARVPPEVLGDVYLGNTLGGLLAWYGNPVMPLVQMLDALTDLFWSGVRTLKPAHQAAVAAAAAAAPVTKVKRAAKRAAAKPGARVKKPRR